jgi:hypothetical protein
MIQKIESGEIGSGDQLMVTIDTHGAKKSNNVKTHKVAFAYNAARN